MTDVDRAVDVLIHALTHAVEEGKGEGLSPYVDWHDLYNSDHGDEEWLAWPVIPARRQVVVYAPAKAGKSLVVLDIAASVASGKPVLGQENNAGKRHVLYLDYEMTGSDLLERLVEMGYEPEDLTHLHYALLPIIPALNTPEGAKVVREMAAECKAELVVIDTLSRAVDGDINSPGTVSDFYKWTGIALKADGVALARLDHEGKDSTRGMIGSSMKATDVDMVWHLKKTDDGLLLTRKATRIMWGEDEVAVTVKRDPLRHIIAPRGWAAGTGKIVEQLDALNLPDDVSVRKAKQALSGADITVGRDALADACRRRRERSGLEALINQHSGVPDPRRNTSIDTSIGTPHGTPAENAVTRAEHLTEHHGTPDSSGVPSGSPSIEGNSGQDHPRTSETDDVEDEISGFLEEN